MYSKQGYIAAGTEQLHYLQWGKGSQLLVAFHGYGNDAAVFEPLIPLLSDSYTIVSFDLPHHGKSAWTPGVALTEQWLTELIEALKATYDVSKVSLLGFSMGGRVCLSIVSRMPKSVARLVLIAPDGLTVNFYYYFFTNTYFGKKIFRHMLENPKPYFRIMNWLRDRNLVDSSRHKFAMHYLHTEESRRLLLRVWTDMSAIMPNPDRARMMIRMYSVPVTLFMGVHDKIMAPALGRKFVSGLKTAHLVILDKGHRLLERETAEQIAKPFL